MLLALALEPVPHILVLDEPLSGVDIEGSTSCWRCWTSCGRSTTCPSCCPPTTLPPLGQFADKVILLNKRVLRMGPPEEVTSLSGVL